MTYRIFIPLIIILCSSCKENKNEKIAHLIAEWEGREIIFPKNNLFTTPNGDTIYNIPESDYKIVTFIDSLGCTICKLQLTKWKKFISEIDTLCKYKTPILFFLQTNSPNKIKDILTKEDFLYPVCVDLQDSLNLLNHFPKRSYVSNIFT